MHRPFDVKRDTTLRSTCPLACESSLASAQQAGRKCASDNQVHQSAPACQLPSMHLRPSSRHLRLCNLPKSSSRIQLRGAPNLDAVPGSLPLSLGAKQLYTPTSAQDTWCLSPPAQRYQHRKVSVHYWKNGSAAIQTMQQEFLFQWCRQTHS